MKILGYLDDFINWFGNWFLDSNLLIKLLVFGVTLIILFYSIWRYIQPRGDYF